MNAQEFIDAIKIVVVDGGIEATESKLIEPPGKKPDQNLIEMSKWFNNLNAEDKTMMLKIVKESVEMSTFIFLSVLDGVTAIDDIGPKGKLEVYYVKEGKRQLLNDFNAEFLHDLFNAR